MLPSITQLIDVGANTHLVCVQLPTGVAPRPPTPTPLVLLKLKSLRIRFHRLQYRQQTANTQFILTNPIKGLHGEM